MKHRKMAHYSKNCFHSVLAMGSVWVRYGLGVRISRCSRQNVSIRVYCDYEIAPSMSASLLYHHHGHMANARRIHDVAGLAQSISRIEITKDNCREL